MYFEKYDKRLKAEIDRMYNNIDTKVYLDSLSVEDILEKYEVMKDDPYIDEDLLQIYPSSIKVNNTEKEKAFYGLLILSLGLYLNKKRDEVLEDSVDYGYNGSEKDPTKYILAEYSKYDENKNLTKLELDQKYKQEIWRKINLLKIEIDLSLEKKKEINKDALEFSKYDMFRLLKTESAIAYNGSVIDKLKETTNTKYVYIKTEPSACKKCMSLAGIPVPIEDIEVVPPLHPNCRCHIEEIVVESVVEF